MFVHLVRHVAPHRLDCVIGARYEQHVEVLPPRPLADPFGGLTEHPRIVSRTAPFEGITCRGSSPAPPADHALDPPLRGVNLKPLGLLLFHFPHPETIEA